MKVKSLRPLFLIRNRVAKTVDAAARGQPRMFVDDAAVGPGEADGTAGVTRDAEPALVHQAMVTAAR